MLSSQVSCISTRWTTEKLDREQGLLCLLPSESGVVHLKGSRHEERVEGEEEGKGEGQERRGGGTKRGLIYSDIPLGPTLVSGRG